MPETDGPLAAQPSRTARPKLGRNFRKEFTRRPRKTASRAVRVSELGALASTAAQMTGQELGDLFERLLAFGDLRSVLEDAPHAFPEMQARRRPAA